MNELEPKPPEILQTLKWLLIYGRRYWKLILAGIVASLIVISVPILISMFFKGSNGEKKETGISGGDEEETVSVQIQISAKEIEVGEKVQAQVLAFNAQGNQIVEFQRPLWKSSSPFVASVTPMSGDSAYAHINGEGTGDALITASIGNQIGEASIHVHNQDCVSISYRIDNYFLKVTIDNECSQKIEFLAYVKQEHGPYSFVSSGIGFVASETISRALESGGSATLNIYWGGDCAGSAVDLIIEPTDHSSLDFKQKVISLEKVFAGEDFRCSDELLKTIENNVGVMFPTWMLPVPRPRGVDDVECVTSGMSIFVNFNHRRHINILGGNREATCARCHHHYVDPYKDLMNCWICHENESEKRAARTYRGLTVRRIGHWVTYKNEFPCVDCHQPGGGPLLKKPDGTDNCRACHDADEQSHFGGRGFKQVQDNSGRDHPFTHLDHSNIVLNKVQMRCTACHHRFIEGTRCDTRTKCNTCHTEGSWEILLKLASGNVVSMEEGTMCTECHSGLKHRKKYRFGQCTSCHDKHTTNSIWNRVR